MTSNAKWRLPVPSTALLDGGPIFETRLRREVAIRFSFESAEGVRRTTAIVFERTEAYKCTYFGARDASMLAAYDTLVDRGMTSWLTEAGTNLKKNGCDSQGIVHLMIYFDDGPAYEFVCRSFRIEEG
jgi:hypothetical protein